MTTPQAPSAAAVLKNFFGLKEGQTLRDFAAELKSLSDAEKAQLVDGIVNESLTY